MTQAGIGLAVWVGGKRIGIAVCVGDGVMPGVSVGMLTGNGRGRLSAVQAKVNGIVTAKKAKSFTNFILVACNALLRS